MCIDVRWTCKHTTKTCNICKHVLHYLTWKILCVYIKELQRNYFMYKQIISLCHAFVACGFLFSSRYCLDICAWSAYTKSPIGQAIKKARIYCTTTSTATGWPTWWKTTSHRTPIDPHGGRRPTGHTHPRQPVDPHGGRLPVTERQLVISQHV